MSQKIPKGKGKSKSKTIPEKTIISTWNESIKEIFPYSRLIEILEINIEHLKNLNYPLGISNLEDLNEKFEFSDLNWRLAVSSLTLVVSDEINSETYSLLPTNQAEFVNYLSIIILKLVDNNEVEKVSKDLFDISKLEHKRKPDKPKDIICLLDQILICKPRGTVHTTFKEKIDPYFDVDIACTVPKEIPRLYKCNLTKNCSNHPFIFYRFFLENYPFSYKDAQIYHNLLEKTKKGKKYANLTDKKVSLSRTIANLKYVNTEYRFGCDDARVFDYILKNINLYRPVEPIKTVKFSRKNSKSGTIKKRRKNIPVNIRNQLWEKYFNSLDGICHCCARPIRFSDFEAGHIVADALGGAVTLGNLRPLCRGCNRGMGTMNMYDYIEKFKFPGPPEINHDKTVLLLAPKDRKIKKKIKIKKNTK